VNGQGAKWLKTVEKGKKISFAHSSRRTLRREDLFCLYWMGENLLLSHKGQSIRRTNGSGEGGIH